jgi:uncharacterized iron-regulated protein
VSLASVFGARVAVAQLYDGKTLDQIHLTDITKNIEPGTVLVVGEYHGYKPHHQNQRDLLAQLSGQGLSFHLGMEFFTYTDQDRVDEFLDQKISEVDFLKSIGWGGISFDNYREQVWAPLRNQGRTFALNSPRSLTGKVSRFGIDALTPEERQLLPPNLTWGRAEYFERFRETMKDHAPVDAIERFFQAQSIWDDTMAWQAVEIMKRDPNHVLVIIVGDFHVSWYGGLPDRLKSRGITKLKVISQVADIQDLNIHPTYGPRADYIWLSKHEYGD